MEGLGQEKLGNLKEMQKPTVTTAFGAVGFGRVCCDPSSEEPIQCHIFKIDSAGLRKESGASNRMQS